MKCLIHPLSAGRADAKDSRLNRDFPISIRKGDE